MRLTPQDLGTAEWAEDLSEVELIERSVQMMERLGGNSCRKIRQKVRGQR